MPSVVGAEPCCHGVSESAADREGDHELFARHIERARGEYKWAERHGWWKDGGQRDGEDGVAFHPEADAFEDARGDAFLEEGHTTTLADLMAEVSAERGAGTCEQDEEDYVLALGGHHDDHDVGDPGYGKRDEGAVHDGDQEDTAETEAEEEVQEWAASALMGRRSLRRGRHELLCEDQRSRKRFHT